MMSMLLILFLGFANTVWATTRHVPVDYPTIQAALDALSEADTVLVDTGVYEEALLAPSILFTLRGNVTPDTGDYPRPIIDPSSLSNPTGRTCVRMDSGTVTIEDMVFRNRLPMYPHTGDTTGGVYHPHGEITVRRCVFDSTFHSVGAFWADVIVSDCAFRHMSGWGVLSYRKVTATSCDFHSDMVLWAQLTIRDGSRVENCHFWGHYGTDGIRSFLHAGGENVQVHDCVFGPGDAAAGLCYFLCWNSVFENNVIENYSAGGGSIFNAQVNSTAPLTIRNNVLRNCSTPQAFPERSLFGFDLGMEQSCDSCAIEFRDNVIENCSGFHGAPGVYAASGAVDVHHNRFTQIFPLAVWARDSSCVLRENLIYENGIGLEADSGVAVDARWNWWGDSTGPYHTPDNPNGHGDLILGDAVEFSPWYADTSFFHPDAVPERDAPLPHDIALSVFPNPFNPVTTIRFSLPQAGEVTLAVYNINGRWMRDLTQRRYDAGTYSVTFDGRDLPSGIYFARIRAGNFVQTEKVVLMK